MKATKNVLFIHYGDNWIRGSEVCLLNLLRNLDRNRINPIAICNQKTMKDALSHIGIETILLEIPEIMVDGQYIRFQIIKYLKTFRTLSKLIKRKTINLIFCNTGLPCQLGVSLGYIFNIPVICHFHHPSSKRYYWLWLVKFATRIIFPSEYVKCHSLSKCKLNNRVTVIYNGIDNVNEFFILEKKDFMLRTRLNIDQKDIVVGQVGSLIHRKGYDVLIKAFKIVNDKIRHTKLLIIGDGSERESLEKLSKKLGLSDSIIFLGKVDSVAYYMQNVIDINVLASREEGLGLVILQASATGLPNVATDCTGLREVVQDGITGFLFDFEDIKMLSKKLCALITNPDLRRHMGEQGKKMVEKNFSLSRYVENMRSEIERYL